MEESAIRGGGGLEIAVRVEMVQNTTKVWYNCFVFLYIVQLTVTVRRVLAEESEAQYLNSWLVGGDGQSGGQAEENRMGCLKDNDNKKR